ncbi:MAG TPA: glycosyltransferase family 2 protein [Burkholderiales bacterium]|nr:glycosyltransferase family 2 protein [Burkholderiales bacterium]
MVEAGGADPARVAPVSVVVPCYRCADTIERAVRSVASQSLRPAELILIDDGSPDGTGAALERLRDHYDGADWIRIVRLPRNTGSASARNAGWDAATQPYLAFLDADDAWHPRKIEIQWSWMEAHPDVSVTGHGALQLVSGAAMPADPGGGEAQPITRAMLYASNQFITPSVMLRREIPQRFEPGKRYMEDYLLWLVIAATGGKITRLPQVLAYTFKAPFGEAGLSAHPWKMERGELAVFSTLRRNGQMSAGSWLLLSGFSLVKFLRRILMLAIGYNPSGTVSNPTLLYVAAYLALTQAMTGLLIFAGLFGRSELAAEIGIVQAATLATFFAFSGNARNLILTDRASVQRGAILAARLALLLPLGAGAALLCTIVARVDPAMIFVLVARRGVEWVGELYLSESELLRRPATARNSLLLQVILLVAAAGAIAVRSEHLIWVLGVWALLPAVPLIRFVITGTTASIASLRSAIVLLLPHFGSTAASGMSLYAFRALLVLVAGKPIAGDLFAAFAIGSFPGSMFANVLGPSVSLHEERIGRAYLPKALWSVTTAYLFGGVALLGIRFSVPEALAATGKSPFFWMALGWSLLGGVVMMVAQRVRLRLIADGEGQVVFGADVLIHIYLIAAIPTLYAVGSSGGLEFLYLLNAGLALVFYVGGLRGEIAPYGERVAERLAFIVTFLVFLPLFFLISGHVFNPAEPLYDSGGVLRDLPLPVSLLACSGSLLLYGRYSNAMAGLWTIFGLLFLMMVSTAVAGGDSGPLDRAKMLLLLQILLPTFGVVLGAVLDPKDEHYGALQVAIFSVIALIVPAQLAATWLASSATLRHSVFLFGVYQHLQFVPVILVCGYLVVLPGLWERWGTVGKAVLSILLACIAVYALAAHSVLAMFAILAGTALFGATRLLRGKELLAALMMAAVFGAFASYVPAAKDTNEFHNKFSFLFSPKDPWVTVSGFSAGARARWGEWDIVGLPLGGHLMRIAAPNVSGRSTLIMEGELFEGEIDFQREDRSKHTFVPQLSVKRIGPFKVQVEVDQDRGDGDVMIFQPQGATRGVIRKLRWLFPAPVEQDRKTGLGIVPTAVADESAARDTGEPSQALSHVAIRNVAERFSDWKLFGHGIFESPKVFLFGHSKPLAREQRSSAHNFYIDFAYTFGVLALLPLLALIAHTAALLWRRRREVLASETLFALAAVVAFLVLVESNLKVSMRQPYPGIAIFFLWGLLLARLHESGAAAAKAD